jgi:hypothetical protein
MELRLLWELLFALLKHNILLLIQIQNNKKKMWGKSKHPLKTGVKKRRRQHMKKKVIKYDIKGTERKKMGTNISIEMWKECIELEHTQQAVLWQKRTVMTGEKRKKKMKTSENSENCQKWNEKWTFNIQGTYTSYHTMAPGLNVPWRRMIFQFLTDVMFWLNWVQWMEWKSEIE